MSWPRLSPDLPTCLSVRVCSHHHLNKVAPLLKKSGLGQFGMANYRLITNLSTMYKILERLAMHHLWPHVMSTGRFSECQSAYCLGHSTKTALLKVVNDVVTSACDRQTTVLLSLDISAAFDSIDHDILHERLGTNFKVNSIALGWLHSLCRELDAVRCRRYRAFTTSQQYIWHAAGQCAWSVALCHVHFTDEQRCCSTWSLLPSIR